MPQPLYPAKNNLYPLERKLVALVRINLAIKWNNNIKRIHAHYVHMDVVNLE
jgi:hypothetical protein